MPIRQKIRYYYHKRVVGLLKYRRLLSRYSIVYCRICSKLGFAFVVFLYLLHSFFFEKCSNVASVASCRHCAWLCVCSDLLISLFFKNLHRPYILATLATCYKLLLPFTSRNRHFLVFCTCYIFWFLCFSFFAKISQKTHLANH